MNVNRVGPSGQDPIKRKQAPDPKDFDEHKKVEKAREVDPEEQKKSRRFKGDEEGKKGEDKKTSPFDVYPKSAEKNSLPPSSLPKSPKFWKKNEIEKPDEGKKDKKSPDEVAFTDFHSTDRKAHGTFEDEKSLKEEEDFIQPKRSSAPQGKKAVHHRMPFESDHPTQNIQPITVVPPDMVVQANQMIGSNVSFQSADMQTLLGQIGGTVLVMLRDGITSTEVHLDRPEFENSILFGTKIAIDHYKTAPDSFNIRLMGTPQAVSVYNDNLGQLVAAFQRPDLKFQVARIDVEIDTSSHKGLFKRKNRKGKKDHDMGF